MTSFTVIPQQPVNWFSPFIVHTLDGEVLIKSTLVKTVDVYTYQCQDCNAVDVCAHAKAVRDFVMAEMDKHFANAQT